MKDELLLKAVDYMLDLLQLIDSFLCVCVGGGETRKHVIFFSLATNRGNCTHRSTQCQCGPLLSSCASFWMYHLFTIYLLPIPFIIMPQHTHTISYLPGISTLTTLSVVTEEGLLRFIHAEPDNARLPVQSGRER